MKSFKERFLAKIEERGDCWIWTGPTVSNPPVPILRHKGGSFSARRLSLKFAGFETTQLIRNKCGNPLCVHPKHLYTTDKKIREIIALQQSGEYTTQEIASTLNQTVVTVQYRLLKHRRKDLTPDNVLAGKISGEVPGYFMLGEAQKLTGLQPNQLKEIAKRNGWETYRIGVTVFFQAEHIKSLITNNGQI